MTRANAYSCLLALTAHMPVLYTNTNSGSITMHGSVQENTSDHWRVIEILQSQDVNFHVKMQVLTLYRAKDR
eukprot:12241-Heterococcus_DN1.PRE.2